MFVKKSTLRGAEPPRPRGAPSPQPRGAPRGAPSPQPPIAPLSPSASEHLRGVGGAQPPVDAHGRNFSQQGSESIPSTEASRAAARKRNKYADNRDDESEQAGKMLSIHQNAQLNWLQVLMMANQCYEQWNAGTVLYDMTLEHSARLEDEARQKAADVASMPPPPSRLLRGAEPPQPPAAPLPAPRGERRGVGGAEPPQTLPRPSMFVRKDASKRRVVGS